MGDAASDGQWYHHDILYDVARRCQGGGERLVALPGFLLFNFVGDCGFQAVSNLDDGDLSSRWPSWYRLVPYDVRVVVYEWFADVAFQPFTRDGPRTVLSVSVRLRPLSRSGQGSGCVVV